MRQDGKTAQRVSLLIEAFKVDATDLVVSETAHTTALPRLAAAHRSRKRATLRYNEILPNHSMTNGDPCLSSRTQDDTLITQDSIGLSAFRFARRIARKWRLYDSLASLAHVETSISVVPYSRSPRIAFFW